MQETRKTGVQSAASSSFLRMSFTCFFCTSCEPLWFQQVSSLAFAPPSYQLHCRVLLWDNIILTLTQQHEKVSCVLMCLSESLKLPIYTDAHMRPIYCLFFLTKTMDMACCCNCWLHQYIWLSDSVSTSLWE